MVDETKDKVLSAALDVFSERGFAAAGTKAIAAAAGVNEVTLFRLFGSKRNLYLEVFTHFWVVPAEDHLLGGLSGDFRRDLVRIADSFADLFIKNDKIIRMSIKDIEQFPEILETLQGDPDRFAAILSGYLSRLPAGVELADSPEKLARVFVAAFMGSTLFFLKRSDETAVRRFASDFAELFYRGARA
jgi:AcrR family transcriptional regulator